MWFRDIGSVKYGLIVVLWNFVGLLGRLIAHVSPLIFSRLYGPT